ncbi:MAG TPA: BrnT family toxin [Longimicrobium sp.]|nr:BrnT family toxin [Longimicrobium sp.]
MSLRVEWDPGKAEANESKHGVTFSEAATVLADPLSITLDDSDHSGSEPRLLILGQSTTGRFLIVSFTERRDALRLISARPMTTRERRTYEQARGT